MKMTELDPLDELFVEDRLDKKLIVEILKPYICFTPEGVIQYRDDYDNLTIAEKCIVQLLARKILCIKKIIPQEGLTRKELLGNIGCKEQTLDGQLYGKLKNVINSKDGIITIPNYNINKVKKLLEKQ